MCVCVYVGMCVWVGECACVYVCVWMCVCVCECECVRVCVRRVERERAINCLYCFFFWLLCTFTLWRIILKFEFLLTPNFWQKNNNQFFFFRKKIKKKPRTNFPNPFVSIKSHCTRTFCAFNLTNLIEKATFKNLYCLTNCLYQWFSTFLSLWHTKFEKKFGVTPMRKKDPNYENSTVFAYFQGYFKIWRHTQKKFHSTLVDKYWSIIVYVNSLHVIQNYWNLLF